MKKNLFQSKGSKPVSKVLRQSNSSVTPGPSRKSSNIPRYKSVDSVQSKNSQVKRKRSSVEAIKQRLSVASGKFTPCKTNNLVTPGQNNCFSNMSKCSRVGGASARGSSYGTGKKGPFAWPLNEPSFKTQCIDRIMEFLICNKFERSLNRSMLRNPTKEEFATIFSFIYKHLCPGFKLSNRFEDDIPTILKKLKYPLQMPKSSFLNVGSPHTWPSVLAMMTWLVDLVVVLTSSEGIDLAFPKDFEGDMDLIEKKFLSLAHGFRVGDQEDLQENILEYKQTAEQYFNQSPEEFSALVEEERRWREKVEGFRGPEEEIVLVQSQIKEINEDKKKLEKFNTDVKLHLSARDGERAKLCEELEEVKEEYGKLEEEVERLEELKQSQNFSVIELNRFKHHAEGSVNLLSHLQEEKKLLNEQVWALEMEISKSLKALTDARFKLSSLLTTLQVECDEFPVSCSEAEIDAWQQELLALIKGKKKKVKDDHFDIQSSLLQDKKKKEQVKSAINEKESNRHKLTQKCARMEAEIEWLKKKNAGEEKELRDEYDRVGEMVSQTRKHPKTSLYEKQKELDVAKEELEALKQKDRELRKQGNEFIALKVKELDDALEERKRLQAQHFNNMTQIMSSNVSECQEIIKSLRVK